LRKLNRNVILCVCVLANYCSVSFSGKWMYFSFFVVLGFQTQGLAYTQQVYY
jgi:hypothetical protein